MRAQKSTPVEIYRKSAAHPFLGRHFVRACAVETHMDISQEPFLGVIYRKKCRALPPTSIEHRALTFTARNPSVWPHCLGKKSFDSAYCRVFLHWALDLT